jgi:hypothetical protein
VRFLLPLAARLLDELKTAAAAGLGTAHAHLAPRPAPALPGPGGASAGALAALLGASSQGGGRGADVLGFVFELKVDERGVPSYTLFEAGEEEAAAEPAAEPAAAAALGAVEAMGAAEVEAEAAAEAAGAQEEVAPQAQAEAEEEAAPDASHAAWPADAGLESMMALLPERWVGGGRGKGRALLSRQAAASRAAHCREAAAPRRLGRCPQPFSRVCRLSTQLRAWLHVAPSAPQVRELLLHGHERPAVVRLTDGTAIKLAERVPLSAALRQLQRVRQQERGRAGGRAAAGQRPNGEAGAEEDEEDTAAVALRRPWYMLPAGSAHGVAAAAARALAGAGAAAGGEPLPGPPAAGWLFDADNRLALPGSLHRISAAVGRGGEVAGLTYRVGRHVEGAARPLLDILTHMAAAHRGDAPGACFRAAESPTGGSPSLLLLGRPGTGKVRRAPGGASRMQPGPKPPAPCPPAPPRRPPPSPTRRRCCAMWRASSRQTWA